MSKLVIDDLRILNLKGKVVYARTPEQGIAALKKRKKWDELWLDHDLGLQNWIPVEIWPVIDYLEQNRPKIGQIFIISSNPVGAQRMKLALDKIGYSTTIRDPFPYLAGILPW